MPAVSVCLLLDERADRAVRGLWRRLEGDGVRTLATHTHGRHVPHLTLASLSRSDPDDVLRALVGVPARGTLDVSFHALGMFTRSRCWLLPTATVELLGYQESVTAALRDRDVHRHYRPGSWQPHLTVSPRLPVETLPQVASRVYEVLPLAARLSRLVVVDTSTGRVHDVDGVSPSAAPAAGTSPPAPPSP